MTAAPVFFSVVGRKSVSVGLEMLVIRVVFRSSFRTTSVSGPMSPFSPGATFGQSAIGDDGSAL